MRCNLKWLNVPLAILLATLGAGCESYRQHSLTGNLWAKDPTGSVNDTVRGNKYIYGRWARSTLTPLAVAGDVTVVGSAIGVGCVIGGFADACKEGAQNGGRVSR